MYLLIFDVFMDWSLITRGGGVTKSFELVLIREVEFLDSERGVGGGAKHFQPSKGGGGGVAMTNGMGMEQSIQYVSLGLVKRNALIQLKLDIYFLLRSCASQ